jgi:hypothetical protein
VWVLGSKGKPYIQKMEPGVYGVSVTGSIGIEPGGGLDWEDLSLGLGFGPGFGAGVKSLNDAEGTCSFP